MGAHGRKAALVNLTVAAGLFGAAATDCTAAEIRLQGATTFNTRILVPYQAEIERQSGHVLKVTANKSSAGLIALLEQRTDLAMISAPLENEISATRKVRDDLDYDELRGFEIARARIAFAKHPENPVRDARLDTVRRILNGEITNWSSLGGPDLPIRVVAVREGGGTTTTVEGQLLGGASITAPDMIFVHNGSQVVKVVEQELGALGIAQLTVLQARNLPELVTEAPIEQELKLVTRGEPTPEMMEVIEAARRVVAGAGGS